jgi:hypothetical protein
VPLLEGTQSLGVALGVELGDELKIQPIKPALA